jgi:O-antigen/teichoic acid export membrane protein
MFKASHESDKAFQIFASLMSRSLAVAGLLAGIVSFVMAEELISLMFGEAFDASVPVLRILGGVMAAKCMIVSLQLVLSSMDLHLQRVTSLGIAVVAHIAANAALIPLFGALGAAIATLCSGILIILLYVYSASRRRSLRFSRWLLAPTCLAVVVALAVALSGVNAFIQAAVSVCVFLVGLYLIGFVHRGEIRFVIQSLLTNNRQ